MATSMQPPPPAHAASTPAHAVAPTPPVTRDDLIDAAMQLTADVANIFNLLHDRRSTVEAPANLLKDLKALTNDAVEASKLVTLEVAIEAPPVKQPS